MTGQRLPNPVDIQVGSRVKMRRLMLGMSQEKLADGLGITFQQVQKYEKGTNRVGASRLQAIATILDVPPSFFFESEGETKILAADGSIEANGLSAIMSTKEGIALSRAFLKIEDPDIRRKIVALVQSVSKTDDAVA